MFTLQTMIDRISEVCEDRGMETNVKKTKTVVFSKLGNEQSKIMVNGTTVEQVSHSVTLQISWQIDDGR